MTFTWSSSLLAYGSEKEGLGQHLQNTDVRSAVPRWSYYGFQGPQFWGYLEKTNTECRIGHQQSPIDVQMPHHLGHQEKQEFNYSRTRFSPVQTPHGIQFRASGESHLRLNDQLYQLKQFHFHDPSEHHMQGKEFPLEMHVVHEGQAGQLLIVSLLFNQGTVNNDLANILQLGALRHAHDKKAMKDSHLNLQHLLPESLHHFSYQGSLTTPPCTEGVQWIILRTPVHLLASQLDKLNTLYEVNASPVQPLYNREIQEY